ENAGALRERRATERAILEENEKLATEFVRLKRAGLIVDRIPLDKVVSERLLRDRQPGPDDDLPELIGSIRDIGLSNPIRVEQRPDGMYELVQGMRRLNAFRALFQETGDDRFAEIPAGIAPLAERTQDSYRQMVDENLIRKDISFAEMAVLARGYAADPANNCATVEAAVKVLFKSASYTKRSYIRAFAGLLEYLGDALAHPYDVPRNVGVELKRLMDADPSIVGGVIQALNDAPERDAEAELAILRRFIGTDAAAKTLPMGKVLSPEAKPARKAKTTFQVERNGDVARCNASQGRLELRSDRDFSTIDRRDLERAVAAFLDVLNGRD
ncbi:MAG: ParB N-terminal domain-containing protein, partial [Pseudomonadota bacterium]|nr:ParB N-terminal domain-containing protein [Pseudomonadota bacterium]